MLPVWGVGQVRGKMYIERFNLCAAILILAAPGLAQPVNFNSPVYAGGATVSVAVGDFNGDGKPDLVGLAGGNMALLLGNGDGTFRTMDISYDLGGTMVVVADFNGDGKPDLAIIGFDASFSIWLGNGNRPRKRWHTMARERGGRKNVCQVCETRRCCPQGRQWRTSRAAGPENDGTLWHTKRVPNVLAFSGLPECCVWGAKFQTPELSQPNG
jgi:hypothetical protein